MKKVLKKLHDKLPTDLLIEMKADAEYNEPIIDHLWHADAPVRRAKISTWFDTLPEPSRSQAKANTTGWMLGREVNSLAEALTEGFNWTTSKEGHDYWYDILSKLDSI